MADERDPHARLINDLARDLVPVRTLRAPWLRANCWIAVLVTAAAMLASQGDVVALGDPVVAEPINLGVLLGSALTAILAAIAAVESTVPGRAAQWNLLPIPPLVFWIMFSGLGCLGNALGEAAQPASLRVALRECLPFLLMVSLPLFILLMILLRRGFAARPANTATLCGLAAAAGAATLLSFIHPFDLSAIDLLVHGLAISGIIIAGRHFGYRWLGG